MRETHRVALGPCQQVAMDFCTSSRSLKSFVASLRCDAAIILSQADDEGNAVDGEKKVRVVQPA